MKATADDTMDDWVLYSSESTGSPNLDVSRDDQEGEDESRLRSVLVSAWNSFKYGFSLKQKSKFSNTSPVIILGRSYELGDDEGKQCFRRSFASLLWLTYRRGFPELPGCSLTTDSGWGCVLRTGQMLLAQGLFLHLMPPGWFFPVSHDAIKDDMDLLYPTVHWWNSNGNMNKTSRTLSLDSQLNRPMSETHRRVVSWFADHPNAPFSIHRLVDLGKSSGKKAGDWYGPSIVAHIIRKAVECAATAVPNLVVYVAQDCTIYQEDVRKLCEHSHCQSWKSVIILVPVRLGGQELNPSYISSIKKLLMLQCCVGIVGGKPKHSLFFLGYQDDHVLYLDPHYCQPTVDTTKINFPLESFHCKHPRKMLFSRMDPSCTIGFYAKGRSEFESLCTDVNEALSTSAEMYPMFIFAKENSREEAVFSTPSNTVNLIHKKTELGRVDTSISMDEFVLL
ncbi:cysteine protease atg4da-like [Pholidichthys leucotaenia]